MSELKEHKHAAVIRDYYEALASGRINAGWYNLEAKIYSVWFVADYSNFYEDFEYRLVKNSQHPEVKLQKLKERWDTLKDKGTHKLFRKLKSQEEFAAISEVILFDWPNFEYKIEEKQEVLKKIDKSRLPVGTMTQYGRVQGQTKGSVSSSTNYRVHGSPTEVCNSTRVKILPSTEWTYWDGGESPVPAGLQVEFKLRDGRVNSVENASYLSWEHELRSDDIIAYRIVGISPGWTD